MAGTADDVLRIARAEIGTTSGKKYWDWFFGGGYVNGSATPWCACFVSWVLAQAGVECATFPRATAIDKHDIPESDRVEPKDLKAGDPVGYDWDDDTTGDHQGIFVAWITDTQFHAIEGNTSGGVVALRVRDISQVTCGVRPRYAKSGEWLKGTSKGNTDKWWYRHADGSYTTNDWEKIGGKWYYFDADGWMRTGWVKSGGKWYFLGTAKDSTEGAMLESTCIQWRGKWYALGADGAMLTGEVKIEDDGALILK